jgi:hypothetical protein
MSQSMPRLCSAPIFLSASTVVAALAHVYVLLGWNSYLPPKDALRNGKIAAMAAL